jgi:hypothetical protein
LNRWPHWEHESSTTSPRGASRADSMLGHSTFVNAGIRSMRKTT